MIRMKINVVEYFDNIPNLEVFFDKFNEKLAILRTFLTNTFDLYENFHYILMNEYEFMLKQKPKFKFDKLIIFRFWKKLHQQFNFCIRRMLFSKPNNNTIRVSINIIEQNLRIP